ncbi:cytochrome P450 [Hysterangium stoloniferum]|nr:cytochrome P450 [Hysterangium stoloniferum]
MGLTPGVHFILTTILPILLGPSIVLHVILVLISNHHWTNIILTPKITLFIYIFAPFFNYHATSTWTSLRVRRSARRLGARLAPRIQGYLPGNVDMIPRAISAGRTDYFGQYLADVLAQVGSTTGILKVVGDERLITINPKNIKKLLSTEFESFHKGPFFNEVTEPFLGVGVFNSDGAMWQFHRKVTKPFFTKERITDFLLYDRKAALTLGKMQQRLDTGMAVDFHVSSWRFTLDSASEFLLGTSVNSLEDQLPMPYNTPAFETSTALDTAGNRFTKAFAEAQIVLLNRVDLARLWPLGEIFQDKLKEPMKEIRKFIEPIIDRSRAKRDADGAEDESTVLGYLLTITDDTKLLVDETLNLLIAGRDTTASLLSFTTYCLTLHPEVRSKLREEILSTVGPDRSPTYDEIRGMRYLRAVLNETLRLYPPVPMNLREAIGESTWFDDDDQLLYVPPKTRVVYSAFHVQRDEKYWGPDAHIFDPNRWLDGRVSRYTAEPFIYIPFNAGPRICLGQQFALNETSFFMIRLLQRYDHFELAPECQPPNTHPQKSWQDPDTTVPLTRRRTLEKCFLRSHLTLYPDGGLWIRARQIH